MYVRSFLFFFLSSFLLFLLVLMAPKQASSLPHCTACSCYYPVDPRLLFLIPNPTPLPIGVQSFAALPGNVTGLFLWEYICHANRTSIGHSVCASFYSDLVRRTLFGLSNVEANFFSSFTSKLGGCVLMSILLLVRLRCVESFLFSAYTE